jgi:hypothetical protein
VTNQKAPDRLPCDSPQISTTRPTRRKGHFEWEAYDVEALKRDLEHSIVPNRMDIGRSIIRGSGLIRRGSR